jgi:hypothetical protein
VIGRPVRLLVARFHGGQDPRQLTLSEVENNLLGAIRIKITQWI